MARRPKAGAQCGKSACCGSVRGAARKGRPYRDHHEQTLPLLWCFQPLLSQHPAKHSSCGVRTVTCRSIAAVRRTRGSRSSICGKFGVFAARELLTCVRPIRDAKGPPETKTSITWSATTCGRAVGRTAPHFTWGSSASAANGSALRLDMSKSFCGEGLRASRGNDRALLPRTAPRFAWGRSSASRGDDRALRVGTTERFAWGRLSASRWNGCSLLRFAPGRGHRVLGLTRTGARRLGGGARGVAVGRSC